MSARRVHGIFRLLPEGVTVSLGDAPLSDAQSHFAKQMFDLWENGNLSGLNEWPACCPCAPAVPKTAGPIAEVHRRRSFFALCVLFARSPAAEAYWILAHPMHVGENERGKVIELILSLMQVPCLLTNAQAVLVASLILSTPWARRAIGELLLLRVGDYPPEWNIPARHLTVSKGIATLFDPARDLEFAIALLWAHPASRLCEIQQSRKATHHAFVAAWRKLQKTQGETPCSYHRFVLAVGRLGLWSEKLTQGQRSNTTRRKT